MKLLLTSSGVTNKILATSLRKLLGKEFSDAKLAFIPTAANAEAGHKDWLIDNLVEFRDLGFAQVDIVDISAISEETWKERLNEADVLVFGGGNTFYLNDWVARSGLKGLLPEMLRTKVYVGISAGSMIATKDLSLSDSKKLYEENVGGFEDNEGVGLVHFHIRPHFNSPHFPDVNSESLKEIADKLPETIYAIDDNSAIEVIDDEILVVSEGAWEKFN